MSLLIGVVGLQYGSSFTQSNDLEKSVKEGKNPVDEIWKAPRRILSTAEHEEFRRNPGGPSPKAKYTLVTDSEPVP